MKTETKNTKAFYNTEIPSDWEMEELVSLGNISSGGTPDTTNEIFWNGYINWCTPTDITKLNGSKYIGETVVKISDAGLKNSSARLLPKGSVIVCTRATIGKAAISIEEISTNQGFKNIIPNGKKVDVEFLYYSIINSENKLLRLGNGSTFLEVPKSDFEKFKIPLPPLPEQKAIAQVLSTADAAIHTTAKLITQKELRKKWLMQQLLTGKKRLMGFDGEWKSEILGNVVNLQHGYQFRDEDFVGEGIPVIKIRNVIGYDLVLTDMTFVDSSRLEEFKSVIIENGDLLMSLTGNIGRVVEVKSINKPMLQNYRVGKFTPIDKQITKAFLKFILSSDILFKQFNGLANQSAQANFGKQDMDKLKFRFPISLEEQFAIAQVLQVADKEISLLKVKAEKLREQKKGLMQVLLTGKVRLKID
jgi:type I restriction enzyme S subunit